MPHLGGFTEGAGPQGGAHTVIVAADTLILLQFREPLLSLCRRHQDAILRKWVTSCELDLPGCIWPPWANCVASSFPPHRHPLYPCSPARLEPPQHHPCLTLQVLLLTRATLEPRLGPESAPQCFLGRRILRPVNFISHHLLQSDSLSWHHGCSLIQ